MFTFTPLLGAQSASPAVQSLLEFDGGIKILADVGWDDAFDPEQLRELERQTPTISLILLTHPTIPHIGAYAHCCKHIPLFRRIPVYATTPVISLGRTLLQDLYTSHPLASAPIPQSDFPDSLPSRPDAASTLLLPPPSNEDIARYFAAISPLKYSQPHQPSSSPFSPSLSALTITAFRAGHTLGGTIWHIQYSSESVVYAVNWNQARENVLAGAAWLGSSGGNEVTEQLRRPTALICGARNAELDALEGGWKRRDMLLLAQIKDAVKSRASILIPCDSSARALELMYVLERAWTEDEDDSLQPAQLFFASRSAGLTIRHARSMGEWMDESLKQEFDAIMESAEQRRSDGTRGAARSRRVELPFDFQYLRVVERQSQLDRAMAATGPKVFLASDVSMEWGFARTIFKHLTQDGKNLLVLTAGHSDKPQSTQTNGPSLMNSITSLYQSRANGSGTSILDVSENLDLDAFSVAPLDSSEANMYQNFLARQRQREAASHPNQISSLETTADVVDDVSSSSSSSDGEDEDAQYQGKALNALSAISQSKSKLGLTDEELGVNILLRKKDVHDFDVRGKRGREKFFPYSARRRRHDEFGDLIRPEDFLRAEERDQADATVSQEDVASSGKDLGTKRRWDDRANAGADSRRGPGEASSKRQKHAGQRNTASTTGAENADEQPVDSAGGDSDESDYEPAEPAVLGPRKVLRTTEKWAINMRIYAVDYSATHDRRALQMLLPLIKPRKLILTGANRQETESLASECRRLFSQATTRGSGSEVFAPENGASVDASVDTNAWTIQLSRPLYRKLDWQMIDAGHGIVTISGQISELEEDGPASDAKRQRGPDSDNDAVASTVITPKVARPVLDTLPNNLAATTRAAQKLHVGDMRLPELRRLLHLQGHQAEFRGEGTLLIDGYIVVRKSGVGRITVESAPPQNVGVSADRLRTSFHTVKNQIYKTLAVVSAR